MQYIKLYHSIWDMPLTPNEMRTYCAILRFTNTCTGYANVSKRKLAASVNISVKCLSEKIKALESKGLVRIVKKYLHGHRLANGYMVTKQFGSYTKLPLWALTLPVSAFGFKLYCYLLKCADKQKRAFPSLSGIKNAIGSTIQTVVTQIEELVSLGLIHKRNHIKKNNAFGHNQYRIATFENMTGSLKEGKEKTRTASVFSQENAKKTNNFKIQQICLFVKTIICCVVLFFSGRSKAAYCIWQGYSNFYQTSTRPISFYKRKENNVIHIVE